MEIALDHANKANAEAHKTIKRYQNQYREIEAAFEEEARQRQEIADKAGLADRRANALLGDLEESRSLLDSAERGKKQAEMDTIQAQLKSAEAKLKSIDEGNEGEEKPGVKGLGNVGKNKKSAASTRTVSSAVLVAVASAALFRM